VADRGLLKRPKEGGFFNDLKTGNASSGSALPNGLCMQKEAARMNWQKGLHTA
jgi:hypothetical protein